MARGQRRIEQMYAFVLLDPADNTEGVPALHGLGGAAVPMVGADMRRVEQLRPIAQDLAHQMKAEITLCRFEVRTDLERFSP